MSANSGRLKSGSLASKSPSPILVIASTIGSSGRNQKPSIQYTNIFNNTKNTHVIKKKCFILAHDSFIAPIGFVFTMSLPNLTVLVSITSFGAREVSNHLGGGGSFIRYLESGEA